MIKTNNVEILKALADETRLRLSSKIVDSKRPTLTCEIIDSCASFLELSQPTLSHHINKLVLAGILNEHKQSKQKAYTLNFMLLESIGIDIAKLSNQ